MSAITYSDNGWSLQTEQWRQGNSGPYNFVHYVWGRDLSGTLDGAGGVGGLLATEVGGVWYFPLYDNNGNVTDYVSETGEVVASYRYDEIDTRKYDINTGLPIVLTPPQAGYKDHIMGDLGAKVSAEEIKILSELTSDKYNLR